GPLGTRHFGVFEFLFAAGLGIPAIGTVGFAATRPLGAGAVENEFVHAVEQVAGKFEHLLGSGGKLRGTGSGLLHQFAHFIHGTDDSLRAGSLFFDGGIDFLGDFSKAAGGFGNLRGANGLFVGGRADFLRELVDFGDDVGNLVQSGAEIVAEGKALFDDAGAALHVFDGLTSFALNALNQVGNFLGGLRGLLSKFADFVCNNGKAKTVLTGAGRFDCRVER